MKLKINFQDIQQDLRYVILDVMSEEFAIIDDVPNVCSPAVAKFYKKKAVSMDTVKVGAAFEMADPKNGFRVTETKWIIESIEEIAVMPQNPKCPECLSHASQNELDTFGGLCEECTNG